MKNLPPLWEHQRNAIERALQRKDFAFFMEPGTGKTRAMIEVLDALEARYGRKLRTLILAPQVVVTQWKDELLKYSNRRDREILCLLKSGKQRASDMTEAMEVEMGPRIFITNYEGMLSAPFYTACLRMNPEVLICDESHLIKNPKAIRTNKVIGIADRVLHRYLMTGSPVLNSQLDVYAQFRVLDGGETFGTNFFAFRAQYFYDKNAGMPANVHFPNWQPRPFAATALRQKLEAKSIVAKRSECLDLPDLVRQVVKVPMGSEQQRVYNEMKKDLISYIQSDVCIAKLAVTKALRLNQIVSGFVRTDMGKDIHFHSVPRLDALKELLELYAEDHKVIVWCSFTQNYAAVRSVCEKLKLKWAELTGEITNKDAEIKAFRTDPLCRVLIGHPGAGGVGVNLVESDIAIYYSRTFDLGHEVQSSARNHRPGSEMHEKITRIDMLCPGTMDEHVAEALARKFDMGQELLDMKKLASLV